MKEKQGISRREVLAGSAGAGSLLVLPASVLGRGGALPPSEKMNIGFIGIGGLYGPRGMQELVTHNIAALCEVDWRTVEQGAYGKPAGEIAAQYPGAKRFDDWRVMLQEMDKNLDGIVVCSADHAHAAASITAMKMRKHVFCEKPLAHSVHEVRAMVAAEKKYKVATQMGVQGHPSDDMINMVEWLKDGIIGDIKEVHAFEGARKPGDAPRQGPPMPSGAAYYDAIGEVDKGLPVPPELKWDLFVGPAPMRKFNNNYTPLRWRNWRDFGTGLLGDHGTHFLDPICWALDLGYPETVEAETDPEYGPEQAAQMFPRMAVVRYTFPARGKLPALSLTWHTNHMPPMPKGWKEEDKFPTGGGMFMGSKGSLLFGSIYQSRPGKQIPGMITLVPGEIDKDYKRPAPYLPRPASHWLEWVECAKTGKTASTHFEYSGIVTELCLLGNIAIQHKGKILRFDAKSKKFSNSDTANQMFQRKYREGWVLPS